MVFVNIIFSLYEIVINMYFVNIRFIFVKLNLYEFYFEFFIKVFVIFGIS